MHVEAAKPRVVWEPQPGSQRTTMRCRCHHILLDGPRGWGKTDVQLMYFRQFVGQGFGQFWRGVIFDRHYKNLDDLVSKSQRWFPQFGDGARFLSNAGSFKWVWPTGEELLFRQMKVADDYNNYHGHEYPFIGWNELSKQATCELYDMMMSCNRSSYVPKPGNPEMPLVVISTTNPYGAGHNWVKKRFIDAAAPGQVVRTTTRVFNPRTQKREDVVKTQVRIFGSYHENRYLSPEYIADLEKITDPNRRMAWLNGDWNISAGTAFEDVWGTHNVIPRFKVPKNLKLDRSFDWGSSHPFSVGWWVEANGEELQFSDGRFWTPVRGSLIRIAEWYGTKEIGSNVGLKLGARDVARGILEREEKLRADGWISGHVRPGPADNSIRDVANADSDTIESQMAKVGVRWELSDKKPGSRRIRLQLMRDRMLAAKTKEGPALYVTENCHAFRETVPSLPRDEDDMDDVDTTAEDHVYDEAGYRVLSGVRGPTIFDVV
jgi:hypothetical protein